MRWDCALDLCGPGTSRERITIRGLDGQVLRAYEGTERKTRRWSDDTIYLEGRPLTRIESAGVGGERFRALHLDHLGSVRQVTDGTGNEVSRHRYYPFGEEATPVSASDPPHKFTDHERDEGFVAGSPLDYMHARYCSPVLGKFLSVDPIRTGRPRSPQTWNRYAYVLNNPVAYTDRDGREVIYGHRKDREFYEKAARRNRRVREVLAYFGPGSGRTLRIERGDPGQHPGTGHRLAGVTKSFFRESTPEEIRSAYSDAGGGQAGNAAAQALVDRGQQLVEAQIILSDGAPNSTKLHELGHGEQGILHPEDALQQAEIANAATDSKSYKNSESERYARDFAEFAKEEDDPIED